MIDIQFILNGQEIKDQVDPDRKLLTYLRENLNLTGAKNGCSTGHCGACMVLVDGKPTRSCLVKMSRLKPDTKVETVEGLAKGDELHPIQYMFIKHGAVQCGFCTPGFIMSAKALLDENPIRTDEEIKDHFTKNRNLCRCTGYVNIIKATQEAGKAMASGEKLAPLGTEGMDFKYTQLLDVAIQKVTGETRFAGDMVMEGMLHGKILWSEHPHAEVLSVDTSKALAVPGVVDIVTAWDIPGINRAGAIEGFRDQPAIAGAGQKARYIGDSVASVFAETEEIAEEALKKIKVEYKVLPAVFSPQEAAAPDAPKVHEKGNLVIHSRIERGDVEAAFKDCAVVIEHDYYTPRIEHAFLEPESGMAYPAEDGVITVHMGTQSIFDERSQAAEILGVPEEKVRVVGTPVGGAFGGKGDPLLIPHLAMGAWKTQRPVRLVLSREESLRVHSKRHAANMHFKTGADKDGHILAIDYTVVADTGAYMSFGADVLENMVVFAAGPYYIPNVRLDGKAWYTNNVLCGGMRGFGANQVAYALEVNMDEMARELDMNPFDFRYLNGWDAGLPTAADHVLEPGIEGIKETILAARDTFSKITLPDPSDSKKKIGVGVACGVKNVGFGHAIPEGAGAVIEMDKDGYVTLQTSHLEYGQGGHGGQVKLIVDELGVPVDHIKIFGPDTAITPPTGPTAASRQTFLSGNATVMACKKLKDDLFGRAAEILDEPPEKLKFEGSKIVEPGSGKSMELTELGEKFIYKDAYDAPKTDGFLPPGEVSNYGKKGFVSRMTHWQYGYTTQVAVVEVDTESGEVKVLKVIAAADLGKILNPEIFEGQIHGGVSHGLGYALKEEYIVENGINLTNTLHKANIPNANDTPEIIPVYVEVPHPFGPQGVKGFAEAPSLATAGAIINAIYDAVGVRIYQLPAKKEKILKALQEVSKQ